MEIEMSETPTLLIYVTYRVEAENVEAFQAILARVTAVAKAHDGCVFFDVNQSVGDPATFRFVEGWRDQAALDAHLRSSKFQTLLKETMSLGILGVSADVYTVTGKQPLEMPS
jgi:quinol monooxygenase YgiN